MLINEVEYIVGLSKKSIRYYESNGLLNPKRNAENDYRIYDEKDIARLKLIKFLRELGVPIKDLKALIEHNLTLKDCMEDRIGKISVEEEKFKKVREMCKKISNEEIDIDRIDITNYFREMNVLKKEGFTLRDVEKNKTKKILGAVLSTAIFSIFMIFIPATISYYQFTEADKIPWIIFFIIVGIFIIPEAGMIVNLVNRIKEINKGEEDEASKY